MSIKKGEFAYAKFGKDLPYRHVYIKDVKGDNAEISWAQEGRYPVEAHINKRFIKGHLTPEEERERA